MLCLSKWTRTPLESFRAGPQSPLLQSSVIPNLDLMAQFGNFWLTPWFTLVRGGGGRIGRDLPTNPKNWVVPSMCTTILPPKYLICNFHVIFCNCPKCPPQVDP